MTTNISHVQANNYSSSDSSSVESMLSQFRVNELQLLLTSFKVHKLGKKNELYDRARALLYKHKPMNHQVVTKIHEIHMKRFIQPTAASSTSGGGQVASMSATGWSHYQRPPSFTSVLVPASNGARDLRVTHLPFYDQLQDVIDPIQLQMSYPHKNPQDAVLFFSIPEQYVSALNYKTETTPLPRVELQLRFFLLDLSSEQKDDFPPNCSLRIDERPVQLPNIIPTNKPNVEAKRPSRPVNITSYCQPPRFGIGQHKLHISWNADKRMWAIKVSVVRRLTSDILLKRLNSNGKMHQSPDATRKLIVKRLSGIDDSGDITMDSLRVSLLCPLGKVRMALPIKPIHCEHLQCFDANLFLMMNEKKPTWKCPVCDKAALYTDLAIDGYFQEMLTKTSKFVTEVELLIDGQWKIVKVDEDSDEEKADKRSNLASKNAVESGGDEEVIVLDSDEEGEEGEKGTERERERESPTQSEDSDRSVICLSCPPSPPSCPDQALQEQALQEQPPSVSSSGNLVTFTSYNNAANASQPLPVDETLHLPTISPFLTDMHTFNAPPYPLSNVYYPNSRQSIADDSWRNIYTADQQHLPDYANAHVTQNLATFLQSINQANLPHFSNS